jgi:hypothetical protein
VTSSLFLRIADLSEIENLKYADRADDLGEILTGQALLASYSLIALFTGLVQVSILDGPKAGAIAPSSQVLALGEAARILLAAILAVAAYFGAGHCDFDAAILLDLLF